MVLRQNGGLVWTLDCSVCGNAKRLCSCPAVRCYQSLKYTRRNHADGWERNGWAQLSGHFVHVRASRQIRISGMDAKKKKKLNWKVWTEVNGHRSPADAPWTVRGRELLLIMSWITYLGIVNGRWDSRNGTIHHISRRIKLNATAGHTRLSGKRKNKIKTFVPSLCHVWCCSWKGSHH